MHTWVFFSTQDCAYQPHGNQNTFKSGCKKDKEDFLLETDPTNTDQLTFTSHCLADGVSFRGLLYLSQLDLSSVGGEEEHDGETCQKASILDGKGE